MDEPAPGSGRALLRDVYFARIRESLRTQPHRCPLPQALLRFSSRIHSFLTFRSWSKVIGEPLGPPSSMATRAERSGSSFSILVQLGSTHMSRSHILGDTTFDGGRI